MTGRTRRHTRISANRLRYRMSTLRTMAVLAMHTRPLPSHVTPKTPRCILRSLHHPHRPLDVLRRLHRMSRCQTQLPRRRIPAQTLFHPSLSILENRRPRIVPCPKQPGQCKHSLHPILRDRHTRLVKCVTSPTPLPQRLPRKPLAVISLQRQRMPRLTLHLNLVLVTRRTTQRYCCSENKSCCVARSFAEIRLTAANSRAASALRPIPW